MLLRLFHLRDDRWVRRLIVALGALGVLSVCLWLLPAVVASRWCWPLVLSRMTVGIDGQVTSGPAALGWFSPVVVDGLSVRDEHGDAVAEVGRLRTEATLLSLLWKSRDLGVVWIEQPVLTVVVRDDGSNWEDILAAWWSQPSTADPPRVRLRITDGVLDVRDESARYGRVEAVFGTVELPGVGSGSGEVRLERCRVVTGGQSGDCTASATWQSPGDGSTQWSLSVQTHAVGLALLRAAATRWNLDLQADGALTADVACRGGGSPGVLTVDIRQADVRPLVVVAPSWLGADRLQLQAVQLSGSCTWSGTCGEFRGTELICDLGRFKMDGRVAWPAEAGTGWWQHLLSHAATADLHVEGQVDLARLAATLPRTLNIREGATIESGTVQVQLTNRQAGGERQCLARVEASDVAAVHQGRRLSWSAPWRLTLDAAQTAAGWHVRQLDGQSAFLRLRGEGTAESGQVDLSCDVRQLAGELQDMFDLGGLEAAGTASARLEWSRRGPEQFTAQGSGVLENLRVATASGVNWQEKRLDATLAAEAITNQQGLALLRSGRVTVASAPADRLELQLLEPVAPWGPDPAWAWGCLVRGDWGTWLARLGPWLGVGTVAARGQGQLECSVRLAPARWDVQKLLLRGEPVRLSGPFGDIDEPVVQVELDGSWERLARQWNVTHALVQTSGLALRVNDAGWHGAASPGRATGELSFRADLGRLHSAWRLAAAPQNWRANGMAQGQVSLVLHEGNTQARWAIDLTSVELARRTSTTAPGMRNVIPVATQAGWTSLWSEPSLKLVGSGEYVAARDTIQVDRFDVTTADQLGISAAGAIARPWSQCDVDVTGRVSYDLARLLERAWPQSAVRVSGRDTQPFSLRGPLFSAAPAGAEPAARGRVPTELLAQAGLRWQSANLYGITVGPGLLSARLAAGTLESDAIETSLSGGMLRLVPRVRLNQTPSVLTLDAGPVLTNVRITPGMCQSWLKYLAPLVAEATQAEGTFSLMLEETAVPLVQPSAAQVRGIVAVDEARIGPGSLAMQLLELAERIRALVQGRLPSQALRPADTWVTLPAQQTRFQFVNGRVHHDRCEFQIGDTLVRTRGSVGVDQTLALVAELPIPDAWLARDARLAVLRGTTLQIPVSGTFDRPQLDAQALEQLSTQVLRQTANRMLEEGVQRGLQQLLGPRR
jgi:hypothetical protein